MIAAQPRFAEGHSYIQWKQTLMDHESIAHEADWLSPFGLKEYC